MHLTWRSYALLTVIVLLGIGSEWLTHWSLDLWRLLAASQIVLLLLEARWCRHQQLEINREVHSRAYLGRPLRVDFTLRNPGRAYLRVQLVQGLPAALHGEHTVQKHALDAGISKTQSIQVTPIALGPYVWDALHLRLCGCFGLAWWERRLAVPGSGEVVPDALTLSERRAVTAGGGDVAGAGAGPGLELLGLREYQPGMPLRLLDWKASARTGKPWVRVFAQEERLDLLLMLDCSRRSSLASGELSRLHHFINVAARLAEAAERRRDPVGLLTFADRVLEQSRPAHGTAVLAQLRAALGRSRSLPTEPSLLQAVISVRHLLSNRTLVVLLTDLDVDERGGQWLNALRLLTPRHLPLVACMRDDELDQLRLAPAKHWRDPYDILAATELEQAMAVNQAHARRLGAHVIAARPRDLDSAVLNAYSTLRRQHRV